MPLCATEFQVSAWVVQPAMSLQLSPLSVEYWKSTVPVGALGVSDPGVVIRTVAVAVTACPETVEVGEKITDEDVSAELTTWVTGGAEIDPSKFPSPEYTARTWSPLDVSSKAVAQVAVPL